LFELFTAIGEHGKVSIDIVLTEEEHLSFLDAMKTEGYACIDDAFGSIKSESATASREADLNAIRALVLSKPGGFETLNSTVQHHLERWFQSQGAIRSGTRVRRHDSNGRVGGVSSSSGMSSGDSLWNGKAGVQVKSPLKAVANKPIPNREDENEQMLFNAAETNGEILAEFGTHRTVPCDVDTGCFPSQVHPWRCTHMLNLITAHRPQFHFRIARVR
jgi:hypothetical protein